MNASPVQSLALLVLAAVAIGGWIYGIHWKRIASGDGFTAEEKAMFALQDQIAVLEEQIVDLRAALAEAKPIETDEPSGGTETEEALPDVPAPTPATTEN